MRRQRSETDRQIAGLLQTARTSLGMTVAFLSRLDGTTQTLEVVESPLPRQLADGHTQPQETTFCQAILDGRLPAVIPDVRRFPVAMRLPAARIPRIRSWVSAPVRLRDGSLYGTVCAFGFSPDPTLGRRDAVLMEVLAAAVSAVLEPGLQQRRRRHEIEDRLRPVLSDGGPVVVLQPIVELATGARLGAEALSRFPAEWDRAPDAVFAEAHSVGHGHRLELLALRRAAEVLDRVDGHLSLNVSPATLLTRECRAFLATLPLHRVVLELSEHEQVEDYAALAAALAPLRARGMQLAVDDVGAGFSSLRHVVSTAPDVLKLDRSIVSGVDTDPVLARLVTALAAFAHGCGARVVAEGVETAAEHAALLAAGVDDGQGWHFGRPGAVADLAPADLPRRRPDDRSLSA